MSSTALAKRNEVGELFAADETSRQFVTVYVGDQLFGIPVLKVQDVIRQQPMTKIPLAPPVIAGALNLRGRIVTAIDLRIRLAVRETTQDRTFFNVVVDNKGDLYSLLVDRVGDVMILPLENFEKNPSNLEPVIKEVSSGIYRLKGQLMVVLDVEKLLHIQSN